MDIDSVHAYALFENCIGLFLAGFGRFWIATLDLDELRPQALEIDVPRHRGRVEVEVLDDVAEREAERDGQHGPFGGGDDAVSHAEDDAVAS